MLWAGFVCWDGVIDVAQTEWRAISLSRRRSIITKCVVHWSQRQTDRQAGRLEDAEGRHGLLNASTHVTMVSAFPLSQTKGPLLRCPLSSHMTAGTRTQRQHSLLSFSHGRQTDTQTVKETEAIRTHTSTPWSTQIAAATNRQLIPSFAQQPRHTGSQSTSEEPPTTHMGV